MQQNRVATIGGGQKPVGRRLIPRPRRLRSGQPDQVGLAHPPRHQTLEHQIGVILGPGQIHAPVTGPLVGAHKQTSGHRPARAAGNSLGQITELQRLVDTGGLRPQILQIGGVRMVAGLVCHSGHGRGNRCRANQG